MWNIRDDLKGKTLEDVLDWQPCFPYAVAVINQEGRSSVGEMMRSSVVFGASEFIVCGKKTFDKRGVVGSHSYIKVVKCDLELCFSLIKQLGWEPVFFETSGKTLGIPDMMKALPPNPCFIFGDEVKGIPKDVIPDGYEHVYCLRQPGVLKSLNASACAAIVMSKYVESFYN